MEDTIFAPASGVGRAAVALIRISGPASGEALCRLAGSLPPPRHATLAALKGADGCLLDRALVLWFPKPASFTGEDVAELHVHGSRAVVAAVLHALGALPGLRLAQAGEFTRRAFINGKMDLAEVEGLADLIDAETEAQRRQALHLLDGALGRWVETLREHLLSALALAEGAIDFTEDDDIQGSFRREIGGLLGTVDAIVDAQLRLAGHGETLREGLAVAITGAPNAGKSTLLNALAGREVAIVSIHAGTTRDLIEVDLDLGGYPLRLIDTAGLRDTDDPVEQEGIARARRRAASADLVLWLRAPDDAVGEPPPTGGLCWTVLTKADARGDAVDLSGADFTISARTGSGMQALLAGLEAFAARTLVAGEGAVVTRLRHRLILEEARHRLAALRRSVDGHGALELLAEDLRAVLGTLKVLVGHVGTEEVLGTIFARFCIGK